MKKSDIIRIIKSNMLREMEGINEHQAIIQYLTQHEGKTINGNIFKKLPEGMKFVAQYGMFYIKFAKSGNEHLIGYNSNPVINIGTHNTTGIAHFDCCYGNAAEVRNIWLTDLMDNPARFDKFCTLFINIYKSWEKLNGFISEAKDGEFSSYRNPVYYSIMNSIFPANVYRAL